jgi:preprotein translocase subunit SecF
MFEIIPKGFWYDFVAKTRFWAGISFLASGIGIVLFVTVGPNWGLDFTGGTEVQVRFGETTDIAAVRTALAPVGITDEAIQQVGVPADSRYLVRLHGAGETTGSKQVDTARAALEGAFGKDWIDSFEVDSEVGSSVRLTYTGEPVAIEQVERALATLPGAKVTSGADANSLRVRLPGVAEDIRSALTKSLPDRKPDIERTDSVGPKVGDNLRQAGLVAIGLSIVIHVIYIAFRFDLAFSPGAIVCLFHDVAITCGVLVLTRQEFGLQTVSALLTLTGYSLNDTIVVYDRIRENMERYRRKDFGELINVSINETLSRTIMTSVSTIMAMTPFLFIGGPVLREFATVMLIGIVVGTYSSIYVAAPITMVLRDNRDRIAGWFGLASAPKQAAATGVVETTATETAAPVAEGGGADADERP